MTPAVLLGLTILALALGVAGSWYIVTQARIEARQIIAEAEQQAEKAKSDAAAHISQVIAHYEQQAEQAKAEAERIIKQAEQQAQQIIEHGKAEADCHLASVIGEWQLQIHRHRERVIRLHEIARKIRAILLDESRSPQTRINYALNIMRRARFGRRRKEQKNGYRNTQATSQL